MAASTEPTERSYTFNVYNEAIKRIFTKDTADIWFYFPVDESHQAKKLKGEIGAHKMLLSAFSPVFADTFRGWKKSTNVEIINDVSFDAFNAFIQYFYANKVTITVDNVGEILSLAKKYEIPDLVSSCGSFLSEFVTVENVVGYLNLARTFQFSELATKCREIIRVNTQQVMRSQPFLLCDELDLFEILSIESSSCTEETIFDACIKWAQTKCLQRNIDASNAAHLKTVLGNCISRIRFNEMEPNARKERIMLYKRMFSMDEIIEISCIESTTNNSTVRRYRELMPHYTFEFEERTSQDLQSRRLCFALSHSMKLAAFSLPKMSAHAVYGEICDAFFSGILVIDRLGPRGGSTKSSKHSFWRARNQDTDRDYCFRLNPIEIENQREYAIHLRPPCGWPYMFIVKQQVQGPVIFLPRAIDDTHYVHPPFTQFLTYFAGLHFEGRSSV